MPSIATLMPSVVTLPVMAPAIAGDVGAIEFSPLLSILLTPGQPPAPNVVASGTTALATGTVLPSTGSGLPDGNAEPDPRECMVVDVVPDLDGVEVPAPSFDRAAVSLKPDDPTGRDARSDLTRPNRFTAPPDVAVDADGKPVGAAGRNGRNDITRPNRTVAPSDVPAYGNIAPPSDDEPEVGVARHDRDDIAQPARMAATPGVPTDQNIAPAADDAPEVGVGRHHSSKSDRIGAPSDVPEDESVAPPADDESAMRTGRRDRGGIVRPTRMVAPLELPGQADVAPPAEALVPTITPGRPTRPAVDSIPPPPVSDRAAGKPPRTADLAANFDRTDIATPNRFILAPGIRADENVASPLEGTAPTTLPAPATPPVAPATSSEAAGRGAAMARVGRVAATRHERGWVGGPTSPSAPPATIAVPTDVDRARPRQSDRVERETAASGASSALREAVAPFPAEHARDGRPAVTYPAGSTRFDAVLARPLPPAASGIDALVRPPATLVATPQSTTTPPTEHREPPPRTANTATNDEATTPAVRAGASTPPPQLAGESGRAPAPRLSAGDDVPIAAGNRAAPIGASAPNDGRASLLTVTGVTMTSSPPSPPGQPAVATVAAASTTTPAAFPQADGSSDRPARPPAGSIATPNRRATDIAAPAERVVLPAAQAFGAALHRAITTERRPATRIDDLAALGIVATPARATVNAAAPVDTARPQRRPATRIDDLAALGIVATPAPATVTAAAPVDTARPHWPEAIVARIEQLRDAFEESGATGTRIRLHPDALGAVDVAIRHDAGAVHVRLDAAEPATRALLADAQQRLADLAEARGIKLQSHGTDAGLGGQGQGTRRDSAPAPSPAAHNRAPRTTDQTDDGADTRLA